MNETDMLIILERVIWLIDRNRFLEARRLIKQELNNLKGITEQKCKDKNINESNCSVCENLNCNENKSNSNKW